MTMIPAAMTLLGKSAWWLPRWLDRIIPNVDIEGAALERAGSHGAAHASAATVDEVPAGAHQDPDATHGTHAADQPSQ